MDTQKLFEDKFGDDGKTFREVNTWVIKNLNHFMVTGNQLSEKDDINNYTYRMVGISEDKTDGNVTYTGYILTTFTEPLKIFHQVCENRLDELRASHSLTKAMNKKG